MARVANLYVKISADSADIQRDLKKLTKEIRTFSRNAKKQTNQITYAFNRLRRAAQVVASAFIFTAGIRRLGDLAAAVERAEERFVLMEARFKTFGRSSEAMARAYTLAQQLGVSLDAAGEGLTRLLIATKGFGATEEQVETMYRNIVLLGRAGGTSAEEMKGAMRQLSQGLASGRLQGEELRSVLENLPLVAMEIAKELDIDIGKIRQFAAEGKITGRVVTRALQNVDDAINELPETFSMVTQRLTTEWDRFLAAVGKQIEITVFINAISEQLRIATERAGDFSATPMERLEKLQEEALAFLKANNSPEARNQARAALDSGSFQEYLAEVDRVKEQLAAIEAEMLKRAVNQRKINEANDIRESMMTPVEKLRRTLEEFKDLSIDGLLGAPEDFEPLLASIERATNPDRWDVDWTEFEKIGLDFDKERIKNEFQQLWAEFEQIAKDEDFLGEYFKMRMPKVADQGFTRMQAMADQAARNIQDAFAEFLFDPFENGVKGMLKGFLDAIRRMLAEMVALEYFGEGSGFHTFFSGLFKRAAGGPVSAGTPYLVGEKGPELFMPGASGMIIPNHALAAASGVNINYQIDARGVDEASVMSRIVPMLQQTVEVTKGEIRREQSEGRWR